MMRLLRPEVYRHGPVTVELRAKGRWVVKWAGLVLNHDGDWEFEPRPSDRTEEFEARTRYEAPDLALSAFLEWERSAEEETGH